MKLFLIIMTIFCLISCKQKLTEGEGSPDIIGGEPIIINDAPWQISLFKGNNVYIGHICGGSIISENWILTAAHCFYEKENKCIREFFENNIKISYGCDNLYMPKVIIDVDTIIFMQYECDNIINDIALIRTKQPIQLNSGFAEAIPLPENIDLQSLILKESVCEVTGFGVTNVNSPKISEVLRRVEVPLVLTETCKISYPDDIFPTMICAGYRKGRKDSCDGDSGGPLSVDISGQKLLLGIVSKGNGCAEPNNYGIYTNVQKFLPWINETINDMDKDTLFQ